MPKKILLVEDEAVIAMSEAKMLQRHGFEVVTAYRGEEAIEKMDADPRISLVLMDVDLGKGMDGTEAAGEILSRHDVPIVFLSSHSEEEYVDRVREIAGYGYVLKNAGEFVLTESIRMAYKLFAAHQETRRHERQYRLIAQNSTEMITTTNNDFEMTYVSPSVETLLGYTPEEFLALEPGDVLTTESFERALAAYRKRRPDDDRAQKMELEHVRKDGSTVWCESYTKPLLDENGARIGTIVSTRDITQRRQAERRAEESEQLFTKTVIEHLPIPIIVSRGEEERVLALNRQFTEFFGYTIDDIPDVSHWWPRAYPDPEYREWVARKWYEYLRRDPAMTGEIGPLEVTITCADGMERRVIVRAFSIHDLHLVSFADMTHIYQAQRRLEESLEEKEQLMRELNHRVKNNLMMIASLIRLKNDALGEAVDLSDIERQIDAIRIVHESLHRQDQISSISLSDYLQKILATVFSFAPMAVDIENRIEEMSIETRKAVPLGLIVNEMATNAVKHGFVSGRPARFSVELRSEDEGAMYRLTISNTGVPFPEDVDLENPQTLGLQLIQTLVMQLKGRLELERRPQPVFTLRFPAGYR